MSSSPFEIFRRNLKPLMVLLTGLALFAFVVLPVMDTYMRQNVGGGGDEVVATFDRTKLTRSRVEYFTRNHQSTVRFLVELAQETINRGGSPKTAGFSYDVQAKRVNSIGINEVPSFMGSIRTLMLTSQSQKDGFELDDNTLQVWIDEYTDGMFSSGEINSLLASSTDNQMGRPHLYEQLRSHLLARVYEERGLSGMFRGQGPMSGPLMTPEEEWANFLKLNRSAVASSYGVLVDDYMSLTNKTPSEADIKTTYDEGKNRDSNDQSAEPAFHRRYAATIEYVSADFQTFLDTEVAKLGEDGIRAEYERRLQGGAFQLPDNAGPETTFDIDLSPSEITAPATDESATSDESPADDAIPDDSIPADSESSPTESDEPDSNATTSSEEAETGSSEPENASAEVDTDGTDTDEGKAEDEAETPSDLPDQSGRFSDSAVRLVSAQQDAEPQDAEPQDAEPQDAEPQDAEPQDAEPQDAEPQDAVQETAESEQAEPQDAKPEEDAPQNEAETSTDPDSESGGKSEDASESDQPADDPDPPADDPAETTPAEEETPEPRVESFEDVRIAIAEEMVAQEARTKMNDAMSKINDRMRRYFSENAMYQTGLSVGQVEGIDPPKRPDLAKIAEAPGLQHEVIGPYNVVEIRDEPIAGSMELGSQFAGQSATFVQMMYGSTADQSDSPTQPAFAPVRTADGPAGKEYVAWKIEETPAFTPGLDEVRDEVVLAIRTKEARQLAKDAATAIVAEAGDKPLRDLVPETKTDNFKEALGPFTWMNSFGFSGATIGNVPELDSVGNDFMEAVFATEPGKLAVAENQSGRVVYIVEPETFEPSLDDLRLQFKQPTNRMMAMFLGNGAAPIINEFFEGLDEKSKFQDLTGQDQQ